MCGIVGFVDFKQKSNKEILCNMVNTLIHRGPDDFGCSFYVGEKFNIGLGHRRLSILDLSTMGHQPMKFDYLETVYNGEVYNFQEIKRELEKFGYAFKSNSDSEVVLKAFHKWGLKAVDKFIGMFAIALYNKKDNKLFLIRDRAGVKPLYYYFNEGIFLFSSELKSFHKYPSFKKELDYNGLASFFRYGYILAPYTIFKNTYKLESGHYLELDLKNNKIHKKKYWDVYEYYNKPKLNISEEEAIEEVEKLLESAFRYRMVSDVPVGVFLSGGYDSTAVTAILSKTYNLKTFTIGFNNTEFDESKLAKEYAKILGTEHTEYIATEEDAINIIPNLPYIYDEPFGDSSAIPTILVSKIAKQKVSVSLSADGSDEIFGGYNKHFKVPLLQKKFKKIKKYKWLLNNLRFLFQNNLINSLNLLPNYENKVNKFYDMLNKPELQFIFNRSNYYLTDRELSKLIRNKFNIRTFFDSMDELNDFNDPISKIMAVDYKTYLVDDILVKVDRATMSVSLEGREPFLDHRIIELVARLPISLKYKNGIPKYLLKQIVHKYIPQELINRPKKGFSIPINDWYDKRLKEYFMEYLNEDAIKEIGVLNFKMVDTILKRYERGEKFLIKNIWFIFIFQLWGKKWL
jgi:asparagine synthase (glutamine-hydrolysing)